MNTIIETVPTVSTPEISFAVVLHDCVIHLRDSQPPIEPTILRWPVEEHFFRRGVPASPLHD
jgi:hypothetical protein